MAKYENMIVNLPFRIPREDVADLRVIVGVDPTDYGYIDYAILLGRNSPLDGLPANYMWSSTSTLGDDGNNVIKPNDIPVGNAGRWLKVDQKILITYYDDIISDGSGNIKQDITHNFGSEAISIEVYLKNQTINGTAGCDKLVGSSDFSLFEVGYKDENTAIVNLEGGEISSQYRFVLRSIPYVDLAP